MKYEKSIWLLLILIAVLIPLYIFINAMSFNRNFITAPIKVELLTKEKIDRLCNTNVIGEVTILDNTSRNSLGPYTDGSVICSKSNIPNYDFILNKRQ